MDAHNQAPCALAHAPPVLLRLPFKRGARAPAAKHRAHFNPQDWLLCHFVCASSN